MKEIIRIKGGRELSGKVRISGSKNATVALIPAAILANEPVTIVGVPEIADVKSLKILLEELGVKVLLKGNDHIVIDPSEMQNKPMISETVTKLRASYYFMGVLLAKYKRVVIKMPGGCYLGPRPIDLHLKGFEALGAHVTYEDGCYIIEAEELVGDKIFLDISSVGATINIMTAAVFAKGKTTIENAAKEPEIIDIATLLNKMGAEIRGMGTNVITVTGVESLHGCFHEIIPDRIEAATYLVLAATAGHDIMVENIIPQHLEGLLAKLEEIGIDLKVDVDRVMVYGRKEHLKPVDVKTGPYPGFATDMQQPLTALLTQCEGQSVVSETIYTERFKHCYELNKMGADIDIRIPSSFVNGPTKLMGTNVEATDLRCGAALIIAGLIATGTTEIHEIYHIERGYENIVGKLQDLGASIEKVEIE